MKKQLLVLATLAIAGVAVATPQIDEKQVEILMQYLKTAPNAPQGNQMPSDDELRQNLRQTLQRNAVFKEEALKAGLDKLADTQALLANAEGEVYASRFARYLADSMNISDVALRQAYHQQTRLVRVQQVAFASLEEAQQAYTLLQKGLSFDELMQRYPNPAQQQLNDWVAVGSLPAQWGKVMLNMQRGEITREPIFFENRYFILKLAQEMDNPQVPEFEKEKDNVRRVEVQRRVQQQLLELLKAKGVESGQ